MLTNKIQPSPVRRSFLQTDDQFASKGIDPALLLYAVAIRITRSPRLTLPRSRAAPRLIGQPLAITARVFDFGPRTNEDTSTQTRFTVGARGTVDEAGLGNRATCTTRTGSQGTVTEGYFSQAEYAKII